MGWLLFSLHGLQRNCMGRHRLSVLPSSQFVLDVFSNLGKQCLECYAEYCHRFFHECREPRQSLWLYAILSKLREDRRANGVHARCSRRFAFCKHLWILGTSIHHQWWFVSACKCDFVCI